MTKAVNRRDVDRILRQYLRSRSDLGLRNAIALRILKPQSPFEPKTFRTPQPWFLLFAIIASTFAGAFLFFNFSN